jgi:hypothetical protein
MRKSWLFIVAGVLAGTAGAGAVPSPYRSGRSRDWLKLKNPDAPAVKREAEEDWGRDKWR